MSNLLRASMIGLSLAAGLAGAVRANEATPAAGAPAPLKKGDTVYVCGCGAGCHCGAIQAKPGKCGCGKDLIKATVVKVEGGQVHVDRGGKPGETVFKAP